MLAVALVALSLAGSATADRATAQGYVDRVDARDGLQHSHVYGCKRHRCRVTTAGAYSLFAGQSGGTLCKGTLTVGRRVRFGSDGWCQQAPMSEVKSLWRKWGVIA